MASGRPDHYMEVDVKYQGLSEMIVRPKYGAALLASGSKQVVANQPTTLTGADGKGMTYGGVVWLDHNSSQANSSVRILTDDITLNDLSFLRLSDYSMLKPRTLPVSLNKYDPVNHIYSVGIAFGITFETSIELSYTEANGTTPTVHYRLFYAII